jgi:hypothetical protein
MVLAPTKTNDQLTKRSQRVLDAACGSGNLTTFYADRIKAQAVVCRYCGRGLPAALRSAATGA